MQPENVSPHQAGRGEDAGALIGKTLGQFRIVDRIGAGGMATVFKAYQPTLDRYVAIKILPAYHARDPIFVKRFVQEARSVAKLAHPNIVQIHDFGELDNITFIVMECVDGGTLKDRLKGPIPVTEAADFIIQAAEGLDCAHRNGIVHRDVKPANMLLRKDGHLLLSDFGIAKILEGTTNLTRVGTGIGTPQYMSPEQGTGQAVDRRSDIYSLGIVFFHCLTGRVPFAAENPLSVTLKHVNDPLPVERLSAENVPPSIIQIITKMAAKQPVDRYQSADVFIGALTSALTAANLSMPRPWRVMGGSSPSHDQIPVPVQPLPPTSSPDLNMAGGQQMITCFRCGAQNPRSRLFCTSCGDDLSNKRAALDRYTDGSGRPVLARLTIQNGPMAQRSFRFHQDVTTIGRTNGCDLVISGRTVSRRHARLWFAEGRWFLADLGSVNGTMLNNVRIQQPVALNDGDVIHFGDEAVVFNITYGS
ncbi:protein kinase domain-containing protein [Ktedonospora formicarum]|uniref:non-specific serine/threonine protein kinase n=1 Tax=Ktedonospora formicarum TaxID=2778364 RepID=A0A8J3MQA2_9CHLR|nr:protein kinase [Ktedonospora formicarum]GHO42536.1 hypothetical protein KSX_06990 [Ktedonospora formicarum]